jgi:hypothetical protein
MRTILTAALLVAAAAGSAYAGQQIAGDEAALREFDRRVAAYVELHRRLEGPLPTLEVSNDLGEVHAAMKALATQIRKARPGARPGDVMTADVSRVMRARIAGCLAPEAMAALLAEQDEHERGARPRLRVNEFWPPDVPFNYVPAQLIAALPPLPPELQYRIIGRALVLWDHHANLVVDFIPAAFTT